MYDFDGKKHNMWPIDRGRVPSFDPSHPYLAVRIETLNGHYVFDELLSQQVTWECEIRTYGAWLGCGGQVWTMDQHDSLSDACISSIIIISKWYWLLLYEPLQPAINTIVYSHRVTWQKTFINTSSFSPSCFPARNRRTLTNNICIECSGRPLREYSTRFTKKSTSTELFFMFKFSS